MSDALKRSIVAINLTYSRLSDQFHFCTQYPGNAWPIPETQINRIKARIIKLTTKTIPSRVTDILLFVALVLIDKHLKASGVQLFADIP